MSKRRVLAGDSRDCCFVDVAADVATATARRERNNMQTNNLPSAYQWLARLYGVYGKQGPLIEPMIGTTAAKPK